MRKVITPEYEAWKGMRRRCNSKSRPDYKNYGARGIRVCERWDSFENFMSDMGKRPSPMHSLERLNNNENYEPQNCKWVTRSEQAVNKRNTLKVEIGGRIIPMVEADRMLGFKSRRIYDRLRKGWTLEEAIHTPSKRERSPNIVEYKGESLSVAQWDRRLGFSPGRVFDRIFMKGWEINDALETPQRRRHRKLHE